MGLVISKLFGVPVAGLMQIASPAIGAIPYASATDAYALLSPNTSTTLKVFTQTGIGSAGQAPVWTTPTSSLVGLGNVVNALQLQAASNLSDLVSASTARTNLGLGTLATQNGTFSGTSSGTNTGDQDLSGLLVKSANLSDLTNTGTARTNLGLGTFATISSLAHSATTGLTSGDDHTQYALLAGRSGGQTLNGDTASGGNLTLRSTAHATKGKILFGTSTYDEVTNRLAIGEVGTPNAKIRIHEEVDAVPALSIYHTTNADVFAITKGGAVGNLMTATFSSSQANGLVFSNTDAGTYLMNSAVYGIKSVVDVGTDHLGCYAGYFDCSNTRDSAGSNARPNYGVYVRATTTASGPIAHAGFFEAGSARVVLTTLRGASGQSVPMLQLQGCSSTTAGREQVDLDTAWATSTDASRKARFLLRVWDTAARECIRAEASGSAAMLGLYGVTAVIQPAGAAQAAITNSTGGTADGTLVDVTTTAVADPAKVNDNFTDVWTLLNAMRTAMVNLGSMKGAA